MKTPVRLTVHKSPTFDLQVISALTNGLPAKDLSKPNNYSNPYSSRDVSAAQRVALFRDYVASDDRGAEWIRNNVRILRGFNLGCTCRRGQPCHADVLLEMANAEVAA